MWKIQIAAVNVCFSCLLVTYYLDMGKDHLAIDIDGCLSDLVNYPIVGHHVSKIDKYLEDR